MKVLLAHKFHKLSGGAEVFYFDVARVLKTHGHEVAFFSTEDPDNIDTGDALYTVAAPRYDESNIFYKLKNSRDIFYSADKKKAMAEALAEFKPDVLHVFAIHVHLTPSILEAAKEAEVPVVMSCNDYKHICPNYKLYANHQLCFACKGERFYQAALKRCCKDSLIFSTASAIESYVHKSKNVYENLVDRYLFASEFMLNTTQSFWSKKSINYGVLKNPFDATQYEPVYHGDYALYFGRIIDEKGVDKVIDAAQQLALPIKIVGDGPDLSKLQARVKESGTENVEFLGPLWNENLTTVLYGAKFVLVPSLWHENFPYVIFQAFAAGKPVIGSTRGGIPELIGDQRGLTFSPESTAEFAEAIMKLWNDDQLCMKYGRAAREYVVSEFSDENFYDQLMMNYMDLLR